ncbi:MAG: phage major tail protein, TP901-1 family [Pseudomonadota bacterium]
MAGQRGRDVLLKIANGAGAFVTIAGIRTKSVELSSLQVDGTHAESPNAWRELVAGAGTKTARIRGSGLFKDAASDALLRQHFFAGDVPMLQLVLPDFGTLSGPFQIAELSYGGDHDGEATFTVTLESAGLIDFEAAS